MAFVGKTSLKTSLQRLPSWLRGGAALTLAVAVILAASVPHARRPIRYARYFSPPRADGTRYTFLYPIALGQPTAGGCAYLYPSTKKQCHIQDAVVQTHFNQDERWMKRTGLLRQLYPQNEEDVRVHSTDDTTQPDPFPVGMRTKSDDPRYIRSETVTLGDGGGQHNVAVTDMRSGARYYFQHSYSGFDKRDDVTIAQSFRVLPPGAALSAQP